MDCHVRGVRACILTRLMTPKALISHHCRRLAWHAIQGNHTKRLQRRLKLWYQSFALQWTLITKTHKSKEQNHSIAFSLHRILCSMSYITWQIYNIPMCLCYYKKNKLAMNNLIFDWRGGAEFCPRIIFSDHSCAKLLFYFIWPSFHLQ